MSNREHVRRCRDKYDENKWKHINQYYCRSWRAWVGRHVGTAIAEDRKKGRSYNIDREFISEMLELQGYRCAVTGLLLRHDKSLYSMSIDRIDNAQGHTKNNVHLVSKGINLARNNATMADLIELIDNIQQPRFRPQRTSRDYITSRIRAYRQRDLARGLDCDIDADHVLGIYEKDDKCHVSGIRMACYKHPCFSLSIDRIDNNLGHTKSNIQLVIKSLNRARGKHRICDLVTWHKDIKESLCMLRGQHDEIRG